MSEADARTPPTKILKRSSRTKPKLPFLRRRKEVAMLDVCTTDTVLVGDVTVEVELFPGRRLPPADPVLLDPTAVGYPDTTDVVPENTVDGPLAEFCWERVVYVPVLVEILDADEFPLQVPVLIKLALVPAAVPSLVRSISWQRSGRSIFWVWETAVSCWVMLKSAV